MYLVCSLAIDFVLRCVFLVELLIPADETGNLIISVVARPFQSLVLSYQFVNMSIAFMNLHLQSVDILTQLSDSSSVDIYFGSKLLSQLLYFTLNSVFL